MVVCKKGIKKQGNISYCLCRILNTFRNKNVFFCDKRKTIKKPFCRKGSVMGNLIIQLISGAVGGNIAGGLFKKISLGTLWNSVAGIVGGGIGGQLLGLLGISTGSGGMDIGSIVGNIAGGGVGGVVLLAIVGLIKKAMSK